MSIRPAFSSLSASSSVVVVTILATGKSKDRQPSASQERAEQGRDNRLGDGIECVLVVARYILRIQFDDHPASSQHHQPMNVPVLVAKRFDRFGEAPRPHSH